jgi:hypothetical protein
MPSLTPEVDLSTYKTRDGLALIQLPVGMSSLPAGKMTAKVIA